VSTEIAAIMADGLARLRSMRSFAAAWLRRHPEDAVRALVPTALGKPGKARQNTVAALRLLEGDGIDVAGIGQQAYGGDVGIAIKEVLADTGLDVYPRTLPEAPLWARAALLPEIRLQDGQTPLPRDAAQAVAEMLMFSKLDAPYPGLEIVKEICDASSLADFAWSLFESWEHAGAPKQDKWAFGGLGLLGDDTTVMRLQKLIREWRADRNYPQVIDGLDVLGAIGGDRALTALHTFANLSWPLTLKHRANAKFDDVAHSMNLTAEQLADRTVPTLGLSAEGTLDLDYGTRRFTVSIDELLRLVVRDEDGSVLRAFPKPGKRDDPELAPAAYKRFTQLKREAQHVTQEQVGRLEKAMVKRRRWSPEDFSTVLVPHLLLGRIVRRLVWGVYTEDSELLGSFRVAEDSSFADIDDAPYEIPEGGLIGVAHPVDLAQMLGPWSEVFADYEILQPFDQLGRPPLELSAEERAGRCLVRPTVYPDASATTRGAEQVRVTPAWLDQLVSRGWQPGPICADRLWSRLLRPVAGGRYVVVELVPGLEAGAAAQSDYQTVKAVWLSATDDDPEFETDALPLAELDRVSASVILRDLEL
jgi:hypothetical protein